MQEWHELPLPNVPALSQPVEYTPDSVAATLQQGDVAHITGLLPPELFARLREEVEQKSAQDALSRAAIGRGDAHQLEPDIRRDKTEWIEGKTLAQTQLMECLEAVRLELNARLMLGLWRVEAHYAAYEEGAFYSRHSDSFAGAKNRLLSLVIYLNPDWQVEQGGLLQLFENDAAVEPYMCVAPEYGHAVIFLSEEVPHEVTPAQRKRYSIAAWFHCQQTDAVL